jgi:hypothetical protein
LRDFDHLKYKKLIKHISYSHFIFIPNLNGFPTDNSPSTQLKYDIVASKLITGMQNHQNRNAPVISNGLGLIGAVLKGLVALVVLLIAGVVYVFTKAKQQGYKQQSNP